MDYYFEAEITECTKWTFKIVDYIGTILFDDTKFNDNNLKLELFMLHYTNLL